MKLTLQFIPYTEIQSLSGLGRIRKLLNAVKDNKIVLMEGRLRKEEEAELIKTTMEEINKDFKGIELAVIDNASQHLDTVQSVRHRFVNMLLGDRQGMTIVGPATLVKEIKKDPNKIQLLTETKPKKRKKRG
ncbi:DUF2073 domain-containing protein [Nanoarchaeota archaeon]